ncbi:MAG: DeoR family transcriptional regulator [Rhodospirillales bacterium 20-64-7]|nr:MAG: DeoR family transcriptional regulator [Rhodospirillales bacterium 20-64-7]
MILGGRSVALQRRLKIAEWIREHGQMRVDELSEALAVSEVTIRSDLNYLEEQGLVVRSFGKAIATQSIQPRERPVAATLNRALTVPMLRLARRLLEPDQTVLIGHGALPLQIIPLVAEIQGLALVLSTLEAVPLARSCFSGFVHLLGGELGLEDAGIGGALALKSLEQYALGTALLQAESLSADGGLLLAHKFAAQFAGIASRRAKRCVVLVDSASLSLDQRAAEIAAAAVTDVIFPTSPSRRARSVLAAAGLHPVPAEAGPAAQFSRAPEAP